MRTLIVLICFMSFPALALDKAAVEKLAAGEADERSAAISALVAEGDPKAAAFLEAVPRVKCRSSKSRAPSACWS
jgi:hypothetical protein